MDKFARGFIIMSIIYLGVASLLGIFMLGSEKAMSLKFVHSHLMLLGWVSMMIFGVGYHILPRFMGRPLHSTKIGELQFWLANIGLVVMLVFYTMNVYDPRASYITITIVAGVAELASVLMFFYNMLMTLVPKAEAH